MIKIFFWYRIKFNLHKESNIRIYICRRISKKFSALQKDMPRELSGEMRELSGIFQPV